MGKIEAIEMMKLTLGMIEGKKLNATEIFDGFRLDNLKVYKGEGSKLTYTKPKQEQYAGGIAIY